MSESYGFGVLDAGTVLIRFILAQRVLILSAERVVTEAAAWGNRTLKEIKIEHSTAESVTGPIGHFSSVNIEDDIIIHHINVRLWTSHRNVADTTIVLTAPCGSGPSRFGDLFVLVLTAF